MSFKSRFAGYSVGSRKASGRVAAGRAAMPMAVLGAGGRARKILDGAVHAKGSAGSTSGVGDSELLAS